MKRRLATLTVAGLTAAATFSFWFSRDLKAVQGQAASTKNGAETPGKRKVVKTDAQWRKLLRRDEYEVTRLKATEPPYSGKYAVSHASGIFTCVCCGADLFSSKAKFDSGTGWPSFWQPVSLKNIETAADFHMAEPRVEVVCRDCGAHLGHVFDDGPPPTGLRYCINSLSLKLVPPAEPASDKAKSKAATTAKAKQKSTSKARKTAETEPPPDPEPTAPVGDSPKPKTESPAAVVHEVR